MSPTRALRLAVVLWVVLAVVVWNVVFDRMVVLAGRRFVYAAALADERAGPYLHADDWMRPAISHGALTASVVSGALLAVGFAALVLAARHERSMKAKSGEGT
jgi:hypothetical protein